MQRIDNHKFRWTVRKILSTRGGLLHGGGGGRENRDAPGRALGLEFQLRYVGSTDIISVSLRQTAESLNKDKPCKIPRRVRKSDMRCHTFVGRRPHSQPEQRPKLFHFRFAEMASQNRETAREEKPEWLAHNKLKINRETTITTSLRL